MTRKENVLPSIKDLLGIITHIVRQSFQGRVTSKTNNYYAQTDRQFILLLQSSALVSTPQYKYQSVKECTKSIEYYQIRLHFTTPLVLDSDEISFFCTADDIFFSNDISSSFIILCSACRWWYNDIYQRGKRKSFLRLFMFHIHIFSIVKQYVPSMIPKLKNSDIHQHIEIVQGKYLSFGG